MSVGKTNIDYTVSSIKAKGLSPQKLFRTTRSTADIRNMMLYNNEPRLQVHYPKDLVKDFSAVVRRRTKTEKIETGAYLFAPKNKTDPY